MIIHAISDLHGYHPDLKGGDLLLIGGDITARNELVEWGRFFDWLKKQNYKMKVLIGGNHDNFLQQCLSAEPAEGMGVIEEEDDLIYLKDSGIEFEGLKIWGSPWSLKFAGINPNCCAFTLDTDSQLKQNFDLIPENTDILLTHCPLYGILDKTRTGVKAGSVSLYNRVMNVKPRHHFFGHIHENYGRYYNTEDTEFYNISLVDENYDFVGKPREVEIR